MKCFDHSDQDAVGICKSCQKGLCKECAVDLNGGLACRARCEPQVRALSQLVDSNVRLAPVAALAKQHLGAATFNLLLGVVFTLWGIRGPGFLLALGVVFLLWGAVELSNGLRVKRLDRASTESHE